MGEVVNMYGYVKFKDGTCENIVSYERLDGGFISFETENGNTYVYVPLTYRLPGGMSIKEHLFFKRMDEFEIPDIRIADYPKIDSECDEDWMYADIRTIVIWDK